MKLATTPTAPVDFAAFKNLSFIHTADWESIELARYQANYARLYQIYNRLMTMNEEGTSVTITVESSSDKLIISDNNEEYFQLMEYLNDVGGRLTALASEILALQEKQQAGGLNNDEGIEKNELRRQALALCLPSPPAFPMLPALETVLNQPSAQAAA